MKVGGSRTTTSSSCVGVPMMPGDRSVSGVAVRHGGPVRVRGRLRRHLGAVSGMGASAATGRTIGMPISGVRSGSLSGRETGGSGLISWRGAGSGRRGTSATASCGVGTAVDAGAGAAAGDAVTSTPPSPAGRRPARRGRLGDGGAAGPRRPGGNRPAAVDGGASAVGNREDRRSRPAGSRAATARERPGRVSPASSGSVRAEPRARTADASRRTAEPTAEPVRRSVRGRRRPGAAPSPTPARLGAHHPRRAAPRGVADLDPAGRGRRLRDGAASCPPARPRGPSGTAGTATPSCRGTWGAKSSSPDSSAAGSSAGSSTGAARRLSRSPPCAGARCRTRCRARPRPAPTGSGARATRRRTPPRRAGRRSARPGSGGHAAHSLRTRGLERARPRVVTRPESGRRDARGAHRAAVARRGDRSTRSGVTHLWRPGVFALVMTRCQARSPFRGCDVGRDRCFRRAVFRSSPAAGHPARDQRVSWCRRRNEACAGTQIE